MIANRPVGFVIILLLLLVGNAFAFFRISLNPSALMEDFPRLTPNALSGFQGIQVLNVVCILGIWYYRKWGVWLAVALALLVIILDIKYQLWYHVFVVLIVTGILLFFIRKLWRQFR